MSDAPLLIEVDRGVGILTLNRPARLNALDAGLARAWAEGTAQLVSRDDVQAIVVAASGPAFCAGGDVVSMASGIGSAAVLEELAHLISRGIATLMQAAVPVVAAAQGTTAGGGLGVLLGCDYVVVDSDATIGSRYASMGLTPDLTVTTQLVRAIGERRALQLVLQERMLSASEARDWGLVAEVVEPGAVRDRALEIARGWVDSTPWAYGQAKRLLRQSSATSFTDQIADEARTIAAAFETPPAQARIAAFAAATKARS